jgi:hypothetical protein
MRKVCVNSNPNNRIELCDSSYEQSQVSKMPRLSFRIQASLLLVVRGIGETAPYLAIIRTPLRYLVDVDMICITKWMVLMAKTTPVTAILIQFGKLLGDKKMVFAFVFDPLECFESAFSGLNTG